MKLTEHQREMRALRAQNARLEDRLRGCRRTIDERVLWVWSDAPQWIKTAVAVAKVVGRDIELRTDDGNAVSGKLEVVLIERRYPY